MGFTRYWHRQQTLEQKRFSLWVEEVKELHRWLPPTYKGQPLRIAGPEGIGEPEFAVECVRLNGSNDQASGGEDMSWESFYVPRVMTLDRFDYPDHAGLFFSFCKTGHMPYDLLVSAALLQFAYRFGTMQTHISADGSRDVWTEGQRLCERVLGDRAGFMPYVVWKKQYDAQGNIVEKSMTEYEDALSDWLDHGRNSDWEQNSEEAS